MILLSDKLSTESLHAFIDEQLSEDQYIQVEAQLDGIPRKLVEIQQCQVINERLREVFDPIVEEDVPDDLYYLALYGINGECHDDTQDFPQFDHAQDDNSGASTGLNAEIGLPLDPFASAPELRDENLMDANEFAELAALSLESEQNPAEYASAAMPNTISGSPPEIPGDEEHSAYGSASQPLRSIDELTTPSGLGSSELESPATGSHGSASAAHPTSLQQFFVEPAGAEHSLADSAGAETAAQQIETVPLEQSDQFSAFDELELTLEEEPTVSAEPVPVEPVPAKPVTAKQIIAKLLAEQTVAQKRQRVLDAFESSEPLALQPLEAQQPAAGIIRHSGFNQPNAVDFARVRAAKSGPAAIAANAQAKLKDKAKTERRLMKPTGGAAGAPEFPIDEIVEQLDEIASGPEPMTQDVVAEFFAEDRTELDFEVSEVVRQFEEVSGKFNPRDKTLFGSPVLRIKHQADTVLSAVKNGIAGVKNALAQNGKLPFPDFTRILAAFKINILKSSQPKSSAERNAGSIPAKLSTGVEREARPEGLSRAIGETLRLYKQKLSQIAAVAGAERVGDAGHVDQRIVPYGAALSRFNGYQQKISGMLEKASPENRMTIGGAILLVVGLVIGGSISSLSGRPANVISVEKVEQLAIDAHILYSQQSQNVAGTPAVSIAESMQWLSARMGRQMNLADAQVEGFEHQRVIIVPTMLSYAITNIFANKNQQNITLFIAPDLEPAVNSALACRVPAGADGLCTWVKDSVRYIAVANLSLSRVRAFSQALVDSL